MFMVKFIHIQINGQIMDYQSPDGWTLVIKLYKSKHFLSNQCFMVKIRFQTLFLRALTGPHSRGPRHRRLRPNNLANLVPV